MISNKIDLKSKVALKFIMSKLKRLVVDKDGSANYMENLDELLKDIFGVKHFTKKLDSCYDDRESIGVINEIGIKNLMTICNTPRIYNAISELTVMNFEMHRSQKLIKKLEKKGKNKDRKEVEKKYEYLLELYKKAVKTLRKSFGTKKPSYKKKFKSVSNLIDSRKGFSYYDEEDSISSILYDDNDPFYDEDDDFDSDENEFERYLKKIIKEDKKKGNVKRNIKPSRTLNIEDEDDEDEDEDDDFDSDDEDNDIEEKVNSMSGKLDTVTAALHALVNAQNNSKPVIMNNTAPQTNGDISELNKAIMYLAKCQKESVEKQNDMLSLLTSMLEDDDNEEDEDDFRAVINEDPIPVMNKKTQQITPSNNKMDINNLSKDDLINFINQNHNQTSKVAYTEETIIEPRIKSD